MVLFSLLEGPGMMGMAFPHAMYVYSNGLERSGFKEVAILMVTQQGMS
jgi:hypothetical protein